MGDRRGLRIALAACLPLLFAAGEPGLAGRSEGPVTDGRAEPPAVSLDHLPLLFVENRGQMDPRAAFCARGRDLDLFLTARGLTWSFGRPGDRYAVQADFPGAAAVAPEGGAFAPTVVSFFRGPRDAWRTGIRTCREVVYRGLWPGIDLSVAAVGDALKFLWVVAPGADASRIATVYRGPDSVRVTERGDLVVSTPAGSFVDGRPVAWQERGGGGRDAVEAEYAVGQEAGPSAWRTGFSLGAYDPSRALYIDPVVLAYSGFLGTGGYTDPQCIAVDGSGCAYVCGMTTDAAPAFPATVGPDSTANGDSDAFVAKVAADGTGLVYAGFIGGASWDGGQGIAVDASGAAYVVGGTTSNQSTFPVVVGPDLTVSGMTGDAFIAKVAPDGTSLGFCGYIGGSDGEVATAVALDGSGNAYVVGRTASTPARGFPATVGPDATFGGDWDGFIAKVKADGTSLIYAGYLGGTDRDDALAVAVESGTGVAYVAGSTRSSDFPVLTGPGLSHSGGPDDGFVVKVAADGSGLTWSGFVGGSGDDVALGVALAPAGTIVVAGRTRSEGTGFPALVGPDLTLNGVQDVFVTKLDATSAAVVWSGFVGGSGADHFGGLGVDGAGNACVAGYTETVDGSFPVLAGPDTVPNGGSDVFVTRVRADGTGLESSGFIGGANWEHTYQSGALAVSASGDVFLTGRPGGVPLPGQEPFPVLVGPGVVHGGLGFVAKVETLSSLEMATGKGALKDSAKAGGDSMKVSGTFPRPVGYDFSWQTLPVEIRLGDAANPVVIDIPAGDAGYKWSNGRLSWKGAGGSLKLDFVKGTFSVAASKATFAAQQTNPIRVWIDLGGQVFLAEATWTADAKKPGTFKYP